MAANFVCAELILSNSMLPLIRMSLFSHTFMVGAYYTSFLFQQQVSLVDLNLCASALHRFFFTQASHKKRNQLSDSWAEGRQKLPQQEIRYPKKQKTSKVPRCGISLKKKNNFSTQKFRNRSTLQVLGLTGLRVGLRRSRSLQITRFVKANGGIERNATFDHTAGLRDPSWKPTLISKKLFSMAEINNNAFNLTTGTPPQNDQKLHLKKKEVFSKGMQ